MKRLFGEWSIGRDDAAGRREFGRQMEARRASERDAEYKPVRRGWCFGGKSFRKELLDQIAEQRGDWHYGPELQEADESRAQRLIDQELRRKGWKEADLEKRCKGDPFKLQVAARLRAETVMTISWIARRLQMGSRGHLTQLLHHRRRHQ